MIKSRLAEHVVVVVGLEHVVVGVESVVSETVVVHVHASGGETALELSSTLVLFHLHLLDASISARLSGRQAALVVVEVGVEAAAVEAVVTAIESTVVEAALEAAAIEAVQTGADLTLKRS